MGIPFDAATATNVVKNAFKRTYRFGLQESWRYPELFICSPIPAPGNL